MLCSQNESWDASSMKDDGILLISLPFMYQSFGFFFSKQPWIQCCQCQPRFQILSVENGNVPVLSVGENAWYDSCRLCVLASHIQRTARRAKSFTNPQKLALIYSSKGRGYSSCFWKSSIFSHGKRLARMLDS